MRSECWRGRRRTTMQSYSDDLLKTFFHGHSYTGSPLGCAAAIASIDLLEKNQNFEKMESLHCKFIKSFRKNPKIKNIRICGTIAAMDLKTTKEDYTNPIGKKLQKICLEKNIFLRPLGNVLYLIPPYCITEEQLAFSYEIIEESLAKV